MSDTCKWCGAPAVDTIDIEPAKYRSVTKTDPMTGEPNRDRHVHRVEGGAAARDRQRRRTGRDQVRARRMKQPAWLTCTRCQRRAVPGAACDATACPFQRDGCDPPHLIVPTPKGAA